jgi:hypothetical protein
MTDEEVARFALQLREAERIRAQIAEDEAAAGVDGAYESPLLTAPPAVEQQASMSEVAAAA